MISEKNTWMKLPENDKNVIIEDDWIGAMPIILKGVTIGMESIIAAGAVVLKDIPRYSFSIAKIKQELVLLENNICFWPH